LSFVQLTRNRPCALQRKAEQREQGKERRGPKIPERAKQCGKAGEKDRRAGRRGKEHIKAQLAAADAAGKAEKRPGKRQHEEHIEQIGESARSAAAQGAQQIINERDRRAQQKRAGKRACLRPDLHAHRSGAEQPGEEAACARRVLIAERLDAAVHVQLAAVETELADVQVFARHDERSGAGGECDLVFVEALHVVDAGDKKLLAPIHLNAVCRAREG